MWLNSSIDSFELTGRDPVICSSLDGTDHLIYFLSTVVLLKLEFCEISIKSSSFLCMKALANSMQICPLIYELIFFSASFRLPAISHYRERQLFCTNIRTLMN